VQDGLEQVRVGALGDRVEEAAADDLAALADLRARDHVGLVEQDAAHLGIRCQHGAEEGAAPAAHVDHGPEAREVIDREQVRVGAAA
jgi:hypothetical protein